MNTFQQSMRQDSVRLLELIARWGGEFAAIRSDLASIRADRQEIRTSEEVRPLTAEVDALAGGAKQSWWRDSPTQENSKQLEALRGFGAALF